MLGSASGGGYDKAGTALGQAIECLFKEELKALTPASIYPGPADPEEVKRIRKVPGALYGLSRYPNGTMSLDGACGLSCMLAVLRALGFTSVEIYDTGKLSDMVIARR